MLRDVFQQEFQSDDDRYEKIMQYKHEHHLPPARREKDMLPPKIEESNRHRYMVYPKGSEEPSLLWEPLKISSQH